MSKSGQMLSNILFILSYCLTVPTLLKCCLHFVQILTENCQKIAQILHIHFLNIARILSKYGPVLCMCLFNPFLTRWTWSKWFMINKGYTSYSQKVNQPNKIYQIKLHKIYQIQRKPVNPIQYVSSKNKGTSVAQ